MRIRLQRFEEFYENGNFFFLLAAAGNIISTIGGVNHDYHFADVMKRPPRCSHLLTSNHSPTFYSTFMGRVFNRRL